MLILSPQIIGEPHYEELPPSYITGWLDSLYYPTTRTWMPIPPTAVGLPIRPSGPNYRRPISLRAKIKAMVKMAPKWLMFKIKGK